MSDDQPPTNPDASSDTRDGSETSGKLISADVFLARLAERRQTERPTAPSEPPALATLLGALESLGLDPSRVSPSIARLTRAYQPGAPPESSSEPSMPSLEDLSVLEAALGHMQEAETSFDLPVDANIDWADVERQVALLHLAERLNPEELRGDAAPSTLQEDQAAELDTGQAEGTRRALQKITARGAPRKRRGSGRRVAEKPASYDTSPSDSPPAPDQ